MNKARIYSPTKNAMQSGRARQGQWLLVFEPTDARRLDPLMGWSGSRDTRRQLRLHFDDKDSALAYAQRNGLEADVVEPQDRRVKPKSYADNFKPRPRA